MDSLRARFLTAGICGGIFIAALLAHPYSYIFLWSVIGLLALWEWYKMQLEHTNNLRIFLFGLLPVLLTIVQFGFANNILDPKFTLFLAFADLLWIIALAWDLRQASSRLAHQLPTLFGMLYIGSAIACLIAIASLIEEGRTLVLYLMCIIWSADTGAYFIGKRFGKKKLFQLISPNKTVEGFFGGLAMALFASLIIAKVTATYTALFWVGLGLLIGLFGLVGDLIESKVKRVKGIKDSSNLLPGHGGILDRFDSVFGFMPFVFIYLYIFKILNL